MSVFYTCNVILSVALFVQYYIASAQCFFFLGGGGNIMKNIQTIDDIMTIPLLTTAYSAGDHFVPI